MNDSFGDFNATQTATFGGGAAAEQRAEGIAPVFIKQLKESAEGNNFQMFGMNFGMVYAVTIVRNIEMSSTKVTYLLEDHTGRIEAHCWLEEGDALKVPNVMVNNYVKVYGSVRSQGEQKTLMVFKITPIADPNELSTHLIEVLNARYESEDFQKRAGGGGAGDFTMGGTKSTSGGIFDNQSRSGATMGLEGKQLAVFQAIKNYASEEGISRKQLKSKFTHMSDSELNSTLDFMMAEGHIYSSIDSDHFISTE